MQVDPGYRARLNALVQRRDLYTRFILTATNIPSPITDRQPNMVQARRRNGRKIGLCNPGVPVIGECRGCRRAALQRAKRPFVNDVCIALVGH